MSAYLRHIGALYATDYTRRLKTCMHCGSEFTDVTKRNLRRTCDDECDTAAMVAKRHARGNYAQTEAQKDKKRIACKATYASRDVFGPELRAKFADTMRRTWREGRIDTTKHWAKTPDGKRRLSALFKGTKRAPQPNMSLAAQRRLRTRRETLYTSANGGFRPDVGMYFRSNWEANFARILTLQGKHWEYETKTFQLEASLSYTPDFYDVDAGVYYELKGRLDEKSCRQLTLMAEKFPHVTLHLIDGVKYAELRVQYKGLLPAWEGK